MKKILITFTSIIALLLVIAATMPKDFKIEQQISINKSPAEIYNYLRMLNNGNEWSPWMGKDKNMTKEFTGTDGEVGATVSWAGNKDVGVGKQVITTLTKNEKIEFELHFKEPMEMTNKGYFEIKPLSETQTKVTWAISGRTPFPFNAICYFMHKQVEKEFTFGLENIKRILEK